MADIFSHQPVIVSIDIGGYKCGSRLISDVGVAILDTAKWSQYGKAIDSDVSNAIEARYFVLTRWKVPNTTWVEQFLFGQNEKMDVDELRIVSRT